MARATYRDSAPASIATLPDIARFHDEPFADPSQLPTFAVSAATREFVTVALSGDGGDELFSGYPHHDLAAGLSRLDRVPTGLLKTVLAPLARFSPVATRGRDWAERMSLDPDRRRFSTIRLPSRSSRVDLLHPDLRQSREEREWYYHPHLERLKGLPPVTQTQMFDLEFYLPNDMLVKVDRASMAVGLEVRVPFLTKHMTELSLSIPEGMRYVRGEDKRVLRRIVERRYGTEFARRKKRGFSIPLNRWMRDAATPAREGYILESGPMKAGILNAQGVRRLFSDIRRGNGIWHVDRSEELFAILCFDAWWSRYRE
ncbi:MAG: asparagine synthase C-terminal domain-containing protein [Pirellulales bacterium]